MLSGSRNRYFARLLPVPVAIYESRYLFGSAGHGITAVRGLAAHSGFGALLLLAVLATLAAVLLREMGRGLPAWTSGPERSGRFVGLWLLCSAALLACLSCEQLWRDSAAAGVHMGVAQIASGGGWPSILSAVLVGFLLAASLRSTRWILRAVGKWLRPRAAALVGPAPLRALVSSSALLPRPASVVDGWSSRGPPLRAAVAVSIS